VLVLEAQARTREAITAQFDALSVELLGARAAGLSRQRIEELIASGHLNAQALEGLDMASLSEPANPILFIRLISGPYSEADPLTRARMRDYTLDQWARDQPAH
jgi:hypothetical protein